jgi:Family of unknown function (DUF5677)
LDDLQKTLHRAIAELLKPEKVLARILVQKLRKRGVEKAEQQFDSIETAVKRVLDNPGADGRLSWKLRMGNSVLDEKIRQLSLDASDVDAMAKTYGESIRKAMPAIVDDMTLLMLKRIKRDAPEGLRARDTQRVGFEQRLEHRWRKPLALLALEIGLAVKIGAAANKVLRRRRAAKRAHVVEAATRIHARACQVAGEVDALLRGGFADGALARWRTLHELSVVCWFLVQHGETVAERYFLHLDIDTLRAAEQYAEFAPLLRYRPIPRTSAGERSNDDRRLARIHLLHAFVCVVQKLVAQHFDLPRRIRGEFNAFFVDATGRVVHFQGVRPSRFRGLSHGEAPPAAIRPKNTHALRCRIAPRARSVRRGTHRPGRRARCRRGRCSALGLR